MIGARRVVVGLLVGALVAGLVAVDWTADTFVATSVLLIALTCGALWELCGMLGRAGIPTYPRFAVGASAVLMSMRAASGWLGLTGYEAREVFLAGLAMAALGPFVAGIARARGPVEPDPDLVRRAGATALGLCYVTLLGSFLLELRLIEDARGSTELGLGLAFLLAAAVKIGDSAAYFVGRTIGRIQLSPVSPKKTWEGAAASVIGSVAVSVFGGALVFDFDWRVMAGFGLVADLAGQAGDLVESYVKRVLGTKDSATTFGEMGGMLDMMDALLLAAPAAFLWAELLIARGG